VIALITGILNVTTGHWSNADYDGMSEYIYIYIYIYNIERERERAYVVLNKRKINKEINKSNGGAYKIEHHANLLFPIGPLLFIHFHLLTQICKFVQTVACTLTEISGQLT